MNAICWKESQYAEKESPAVRFNEGLGRSTMRGFHRLLRFVELPRLLLRIHSPWFQRSEKRVRHSRLRHSRKKSAQKTRRFDQKRRKPSWVKTVFVMYGMCAH